MIKETLNGHIMSAMKAGDKIRTKALRAIKDGIMNWETAKSNVGKTLDDAAEITIIRKLKKQYLEAAVQCNDGNHNELVAENNAIAEVLNEFLPAMSEVIDKPFMNAFCAPNGNIYITRPLFEKLKSWGGEILGYSAITDYVLTCRFSGSIPV